MVRLWPVKIIVLLVVVEAASGFVSNNITVENELKNNSIVIKHTRRSNTKERSTSSSSGERSASKGSGSDDSDSISLEMSDSDSSSTESNESKGKKEPKSSAERSGWKKWHRKCTPCKDDIAMKWRDPNIKWICGAYQRARRSFKSLCMMHFRNCQDGTMFVKIHDHRCANSSSLETRPWGEHFFYDYKVTLSGDSSSNTDESSSESTEESSSSF